MTEDEARKVMRECGWTLVRRLRKGRYWYIYAARFSRKTGSQEKYIGSVARLSSLTVEELKQKLSCM